MLEVSILQLFWSPKVPHSTPSLSLCLIFSSPSLSEPGVPPPLCPFPARASTVVKTLKLRVNCRFQNFEIPGQLPVGYSCLATAMPLIPPPFPSSSSRSLQPETSYPTSESTPSTHHQRS